MNKGLLEIAPIEDDPDHHPQQAAGHAQQVGRHDTGALAKPPTNPSKKGNTQKKNNFFHINSTKSPAGAGFYTFGAIRL